MPELLFDNVEFDVGLDGMIFSTQTNGDKILISGINLTAEAAAAVAYLSNLHKILKVEITIKG